MRKELVDLEMEQVAGGKAWYNGNNQRIVFETLDPVYQLGGCSNIEVLAVLEEYSGKCASEADYDQKILSILQEKGWIVGIVE